MKIGITGGIGSGKSTVSEYLIKKGYLVVDADKVSRKLVEPGSDVLRKLCLAFGLNILDAKGELKRKYLASIVFSDLSKKKKLDEIMDGALKNELSKQLNSRKEEIVFLDAPLLFEAGYNDYMDANWLVICDLETRIERVRLRDNASREDVLLRINSQMSDEEKKMYATEIIENSNGTETLYKQVEGLLNAYK